MTLFSGGYANETYLQSLNASSEDARRQVQNAVNEILRQQQEGYRISGEVGERGSTAFNQARWAYEDDVKALGTETLGALLQGFKAGGEGYRQAGQHLAKGFHEQAIQRQGKAQNVLSSVLNDLLGKGNEYISKREAEDRDRAFREQEAARQRALQDELMNRQSSMQQQMLAAQAAEAAKQRAFQEEQQRLSLAGLGGPGLPAMDFKDERFYIPGMQPQTAANYTRPQRGLLY